MDVKGIQKGVIDRASAEAKDRFVHLCQKAVAVASRTIHIVGSTVNIDRHGEIILPSAYAATLKAFLASNAPFLAAHTHRSGDGSPTQIGWVMDGKIAGPQVEFTVRFAETDVANQWWKLASDPGGKGIASSVGFMPVTWMQGTSQELAKALPELVCVFRDAGAKADEVFRVYTVVELYELSGCPVPSNRESLQVMKALGAEGAEALKSFIAEAVKGALAAVPGVNLKADESPILTRLAAIESKMEEVSLLLCAFAPDNVNPRSEAPAAPGADDEEDAGAKADGAGLKSAAESLRRACQS